MNYGQDTDAAAEVRVGDVFVSTATDYVDQSNSRVVPTVGNTAVLSVQLVSATSTGSFNLSVWAEGSFDGTVWYRTNLTSLVCEFSGTGPENKRSGAVSISYAFLRARSVVTAGAALARIGFVFQEI